MKYGLQLFSVRDAAEKDYEQTLKAVAEMGYKMIEPAGFFGHSAEEVKAMADRYGLEICSTHTGDVLKDPDAIIDYHKRLGCSDIIIPWGDLTSEEAISNFIARVESIMPKIKEAGMTLHYHNHSAELLPNKDGQIGLYELMNRTELMFQVDTFWVYNAKLDPVKFIEEHKDRISIVHLKDGIPPEQNEENPHANVIRCALGEGKAPVAAVRDKAIELGFKMVVESEGLQPTGLEEVKRCIDYLRSLD